MGGEKDCRDCKRIPMVSRMGGRMSCTTTARRRSACSASRAPESALAQGPQRPEEETALLKADELV